MLKAKHPKWLKLARMTTTRHIRNSCEHDIKLLNHAKESIRRARKNISHSNVKNKSLPQRLQT